MSDKHDSHGNGPTKENQGRDEQTLRATLHQAGWVETTAFVEPGTPVACGGEKRSERTPEAKRKAEERDRKLAEGWRQHNVMAPDDEDARAAQPPGTEDQIKDRAEKHSRNTNRSRIGDDRQTRSPPAWRRRGSGAKAAGFVEVAETRERRIKDEDLYKSNRPGTASG